MNAEKIYIPEGVKEIESSAFERCSNLQSVTLPDSLVKIGDRAFIDCKIESLELPKNLSHIGRAAFNLSPIKILEIQSDIEIGDYAFIIMI